MNHYITRKFRSFCEDRGLEYEGLSQSDRATMFEHFSSYVILRRWHLENFQPGETDSIIIGGHFDHQLDAAAVVMKDRLITTAEQFEQVASEPEADVVKIIFVQSTMTERFDLQKMQVFVNGAQMFLDNEDFFRANEGLRRQRELSAAIIEQFPGVERENVHVYLYFVALPEAERKDLVTQWRRWSENLIRKGGFQNVTVEGLNEGRFMRCLDRIDVQKGLQSTQPVESYQCSIPVADLLEVPSGVEAPASSYIGCIPAPEFLRLLERDDGQGLLESVFMENVRGFKGLNAVVNRAIGETITNQEERSQFFLRNNGITIVADEARYEGGVLTLKNYQIVNGLQTSHVLYHHRASFEGANPEILLPVKIAVTTDPAIKDGIIEGTNRQSEINEVEFLSRRPILRRVERFFDDRRNADEGPPLWLERRQGQFNSDDIPAAAIITPRDLMMVYAATFLDYPHEAKIGPSKVIKRVPSQIFAEDHPPESYHLAAWLLYLVRSWCLTNRITGKRIIDWHLAFGLRHYLHPAIFPRNGDPVAVAEFNVKLREKLNNAKLVERRIGQTHGIVNAILNQPRKKGARNPTDFLALAKTTAHMIHLIHTRR